jgi:acylphosphatase
MRSVRVVARGRVQGVGYRWFIRDAADGAGIAGWVRNRRGGTVEAELHGAPAAVDTVVEAMRDGPPGARVDALEVIDIEHGMSVGFEIRPTV